MGEGKTIDVTACVVTAVGCGRVLGRGGGSVNAVIIRLRGAGTGREQSVAIPPADAEFLLKELPEHLAHARGEVN